MECTECLKWPVARGLCSRHYQQWRRTESPKPRRDLSGKWFYHKTRPCIVPECRNELVSKGLCSFHYSIWMQWGDDSDYSSGTTGNNRLPKALTRMIEGCYLKGYTKRLTARQVGITPLTVSNYYSMFRKKYGAVKCSCGQDSRHQGWCWWRFRNSSARQGKMKKMGHWHGPITVGLYDKEFVGRLWQIQQATERQQCSKTEREELRSWRKGKKVYGEVLKALRNPQHLQSLRRESQQGRTSHD